MRMFIKRIKDLVDTLATRASYTFREVTQSLFLVKHTSKDSFKKQKQSRVHLGLECNKSWQKGKPNLGDDSMRLRMHVHKQQRDIQRDRLQRVWWPRGTGWC